MDTTGAATENRGPRFGPSDTSPEAQCVFDDAHRRMPAWRKWLNVLRIRGSGLDHDYLAHWAQELGILDLLERSLDEARV
ncbi:MAG: hypothetical protein P4L84_33315 [Isosphaeraceae bacterium]|nr:hypothetical protein [Isosphaeraceae bacterium]